MGLVDDSQMEGQVQMPFAKLSRREARDKVSAYLNNQRTTLWSRSYDLSQWSSRQACEEHLMDVLTDLKLVEDPLV